MAETRRVRPSMARDASPEAYGDAMVLCQGYPPGCSDAGECLNDNWCLTPSGIAFRNARKRIAELIECEFNGPTKYFLRFALDALDHDRFQEKTIHDWAEVRQIHEEVRRVFEQRRKSRARPICATALNAAEKGEAV